MVEQKVAEGGIRKLQQYVDGMLHGDPTTLPGMIGICVLSVLLVASLIMMRLPETYGVGKHKFRVRRITL